MTDTPDCKVCATFRETDRRLRALVEKLHSKWVAERRYSKENEAHYKRMIAELDEQIASSKKELQELKDAIRVVVLAGHPSK